MIGAVADPLLFRDHGTFVMTVFVGLLVTNLILLAVGLIGTRAFGLVARVPLRVLGPFVLLLIVVGSYAYANYTAHVVMVLVLSAVAFHFEKATMPTASQRSTFLSCQRSRSESSIALSSYGMDDDFGCRLA
jgi:putative tricarboxylic transport membrane protein